MATAIVLGVLLGGVRSFRGPSVTLKVAIDAAARDEELMLSCGHMERFSCQLLLRILSYREWGEGCRWLQNKLPLDRVNVPVCVVAIFGSSG